MLDDILDMSFGLRDFPEAELSQAFLAYQVAFVVSTRLSWSNCQCVSWGSEISILNAGAWLAGMRIGNVLVCWWS